MTVQANGTTKRDAAIVAERSLLGGVLRWNNSLCEIAPMLRPEDFWLDAHQRIYRAIVARWDRGKLVDLPTLADDLDKSGDLVDVGSYAYLAELFESESTGAKAHQHAALVRERSILRNLEIAAADIAASAKSPNGPAEEVLADAEKRIMSVASAGFADTNAMFDETLQSALDRIDDRKINGGRSSGTPTGFLELDQILSGLQPSELVIVAARPSVGKTSLGMSFALSAARAKTPVLFISLEQSRTELAERFLCMESRVDSHRIRTSTFNADEIEAMMQANQRMKSLRIVIDDHSLQTTLRIGSNARRAKQRHKIGMVIVDYLQLVEPDDPRAKRYEQVGAMSRRLKLLAKELSIPVVVMAQLNRAAEDRAEPRLSDLRESGNIEQDADVVLLLHRGELAPGPVQEVMVNVAKNRNGRCGRVKLAFVKHCTRFDNYSPIPD